MRPGDEALISTGSLPLSSEGAREWLLVPNEPTARSRAKLAALTEL